MSTNKMSADPIFGNLIYPEAQAIFSWRLRPLADVIGSCVVVLDTNVLLLPYTVGAKSLKEIGDRLRALASQRLLVVPGQVAREFARNRPTRLTELFKQLSDKKSKAVRLDVGRYPLLDGLSDYRRAIEIEGQINDLIGQYQDALAAVIDHVRGWVWDDPVSFLYGELFDASVVVDPQFDEAALREDLARRQEHKIPPGYKDAAKDDEGVGDLVIWRTILQIGKEQSRDLVFVTGEQKADWWHRSGNEALYPRHQLVDEYRRESGGRSFHIVSFSQLLELTGASAEAVEEVRQEEAVAVASSAKLDATTLAALQEQWPGITHLVNRINRRYAALLSSVTPIAVDKDRVVLAAQYQFHRNRLNSDEVRPVMEHVLSDVLGGKVSVGTILRGEEPDFGNREFDEVPF